MKKLRPIKYSPLEHQAKFHASTKRNVFLSSGYGGGKTYSLCMHLFKLATINKGLPAGFLAPTLKMFKRDVLPTLYEITENNNIPFRWRPGDSEIILPDTGTKVYVFHDEDKGQSIKGPNLAYFLINEVTLCSKESFLAVKGRTRLKKAKLLQTAMSGTPEGLDNWGYEYFVENPREDTDLIFGKSTDNFHVHEGYFDTLKESYDSLMSQMYVDGQFININGMAALHKFNRFKHVSDEVQYNDELPVWVSMDFNLNPMAATLYNLHPAIENKPILTAFDEICLSGRSDTDQMAAELYRKLGHKNCVIFPDPAGNSGSTKSQGRSDIDILKQHGFNDIRYKRKIESVMDCLNAANTFIEKGKLLVHPRCKNFIADAERCSIKNGSIDKSNPMRTHWLDGFKDMIEYEFPIKIKAGTWREAKIR